ncbi:MAG TPA: acyl-ACP--UDP-N-acetylglucosamine O-acyltransferase [candidate division Zixibacteria bacterium]|nr:acyl-ACP--UDP-N-acetylglucosamine O-acyltransferase [candidate division Zixibacteria bacterium]
MTVEIHQTAVVESEVELGDGVVVGPHSFIQSGAIIGEGTEVGSSVWISGFARIGKANKIFHGASIGAPPQDLKFGGEITSAEIGDNNTIREFVTINRGTSATGRTIVGSNNLIMAYVHVAHDCKVGNNIVMANAVNMAGHVTIEDFVVLGGLLPIHQFCRIGSHSMVGTGARIVQDIPPFALVGADPTRIAGINKIGLHRRKFSEETIRALNACFRLIYYSKLPLSRALDEIKAKFSGVAEVEYLLDFIEKSDRRILLK